MLLRQLLSWLLRSETVLVSVSGLTCQSCLLHGICALKKRYTVDALYPEYKEGMHAQASKFVDNRSLELEKDLLEKRINGLIAGSQDRAGQFAAAEDSVTPRAADAIRSLRQEVEQLGQQLEASLSLACTSQIPRPATIVPDFALETKHPASFYCQNTS